MTHGTTWLPYVDNILVMDQGRISEQGHYDELMKNDGAFAQFIREYSLTKSDSSASLEGMFACVYFQDIFIILWHYLLFYSVNFDRIRRHITCNFILFDLH